jgi:hypothetical protein
MGKQEKKEGWRIKYNYGLYDLYNVPEIVNDIELGRLRWLGHLTRANKTYPCRKLNFVQA